MGATLFPHARRALTACLALLFLATLATAATPTTGQVTMRIRDALERPVANASATFDYYATDPLVGELHMTDVQYSNQFGIIEKRITADLGTQVSVLVSHHGAAENVSESWGGSLDKYVNLPLMDFTVRLIDSEGNALPNIPLTVNVSDGTSFNTTTNASGYKLFSQYNRGNTYMVSTLYGGANWRVRVVPDGQLHPLQIFTYALEIKAFDDRGNALVTSVTVTYRGAEEETRQSMGVVNLFTQIPRGNVSAVVRYGSKTRAETIFLDTSVSRSYIFDFTAPTISEPLITPERPVPENEVIVTATVEDLGFQPSGMPPTINEIPPVQVFYSNDGETWKSAYMFPQSDNVTFRGRIPGQPRDKVVRYYITAYDRENNSASSPQYAFNTILDTSPTPPPSAIDTALAFLWEWRLAISVAAAAIAIIAFVLFTRQAKPGEPPEEIA